MSLELSAPNPITFFISLILAVIAVIIHYTGVTISACPQRVRHPASGLFDPRRRERPWRADKTSIDGLA